MTDLIDRQAAIEWCLEGLNNMPSAQPERTGRWIEDSGNMACSICHTIWLYRRTSYCPNCGAKMEVEHDS